MVLSFPVIVLSKSSDFSSFYSCILLCLSGTVSFSVFFLLRLTDGNNLSVSSGIMCVESISPSFQSPVFSDGFYLGSENTSFSNAIRTIFLALNEYFLFVFYIFPFLGCNNLIL